MFNIDKKYNLFKASLGILDPSEGKGSVRFVIKGDGRSLYTSPTIYSYRDPLDIEEDVRRISQLSLVVDRVDNNNYDHSMWINPVLVPIGE
ncbi:MAG: NPCBM/NEW2 domain-containing protein [Pseudomonadota bacterium]